MIRNYFPILILLITAAACSNQNKPPENILPEEVYITIMGELYLAHNLSELDIENQAAVDSLLNEIFSHYGVEEQQFAESHYYYQRDVDGQLERVEKIQKLLREEARHIATIADSIKKAHAAQVNDTLEESLQE